MPLSPRLQEAAVRLIQHAVRPRADVERVPASGSARPDLLLRIDDEPRGTMRLQLSEWGKKRRNRTAGTNVWVLQNASPSLIAKLREGDESFIDVRRGHVRLSAPGILIDRERLRVPPAADAKRSLRDPFGDRASLVSRVLADHPDQRWTLRQLATSAQVSTMTASHVVRQLHDLGIVGVHKTGTSHNIVLRDLTTLITRWTQGYDWRRNVQLQVGAPVGNAERFVRRLSNLFRPRRWALTLLAGASLIAPHATWDTIHVYVQLEKGERLTDLAAQQGWSAGEGPLVLLAPYYEESVWYGEQTIQGARVVSNLQLVLDLWNYPVRGREQAEHLLDRMTARIRAGAK
jgi:hypothetical protein